MRGSKLRGGFWAGQGWWIVKQKRWTRLEPEWDGVGKAWRDVLLVLLRLAVCSAVRRFHRINGEWDRRLVQPLVDVGVLSITIDLGFCQGFCQGYD